MTGNCESNYYFILHHCCTGIFFKQSITKNNPQVWSRPKYLNISLRGPKFQRKQYSLLMMCKLLILLFGAMGHLPNYI